MPESAVVEISVYTGSGNDLPLASECEQLVVGQWYRVPCIGDTAVVGDPHVDNDHFNNTEFHFHCDSRFHDRSDNAANCAVYGRGPVAIERGELRVYDPNERRIPILRPKVCIRATPADWKENTFGISTMSLYADYGFTTASCGRCPHKGMPILNGVCSGHRLKWKPDGTILHEPPYTLRIRGTNNHFVIDKRTELDLIEFDIIDEVYPDVPLIVDMEDRIGALVATHRMGSFHMAVGDTFKLTFGLERTHYD